MSNMRRSGVAAGFIDGVPYDIIETRYSPTKVVRETLKGQNGIHGFSEMPQQGRIVMSIRDAGGMSVADFSDMSDNEVQLSLANGKTVGGAGMWCTEAVEVNTVEATMEVTFEGASVTETLAS
ncbi:MAG: phage tail tube protein [Acetobacter lovaniensis]|jgi:ABC-type sulfate transport system substrate-binding protein|nr:phage tail tube protein [Acetobacter lovaniensis]